MPPSTLPQRLMAGLAWSAIAFLAVAPARAQLLDPAVRQVVVVVTPAWDAASGRMAWFERDAEAGWRRVAAGVPVTVGRAGCGWGSGLHPSGLKGPAKREGDGRSPAGVFAIGTAFGAAPKLETRLAYRPLDGDDWCIDVATSPLYNRIVSSRDAGAEAVAGSTEPMRRDLLENPDGQYAIGFVIDHNPRCSAGLGSCIFAHVQAGPDVPTAGCTAVAEADLRRLLAWLDADARPAFVLLPATETARLAAWHLPDATALAGEPLR